MVKITLSKNSAIYTKDCQFMADVVCQEEKGANPTILSRQLEPLLQEIMAH